MTAQRWTTLYCRSAVGFAVGLVLHSAIADYLFLQFLIQLATVAGLWLLLGITFYTPLNDSQEEKKKRKQADWNQAVIFFTALSAIVGGLVLWLI